jgi:drug/metabolite transporter (DMT)-like permease
LTKSPPVPQQPPANPAASGTALTLAAALGFAAVSTLTSVAVAEGTSVPNVLAWRYALASVVLTVIAGVQGFPRRMPSRDLYAWLAIGGGGQALFVGLALSSIKYIPVATLAFLFYTYPAWVTLVQAARGAEKLTTRRVAALALSFGGIVVMVGTPGSLAGAATDAFWKGVGLALGAAVIYGIYIPAARQMQKEFPVPVTSALAKIGAAFCLLFWAIADNSFDYVLTGRAWGAIAALTIFSTVLPSLFFLMGLIRLGPVRTAIVSTVEPFLTAMIGAVVLGQALSPRSAAGGAMIISAVVILQFRRERVA